MITKNYCNDFLYMYIKIGRIHHYDVFALLTLYKLYELTTF